jgi:hypothetical protein
VVQTCFACPSQWDTWTADGDYLYLRFRWGRGYVQSERRGVVASFGTGDDLDGVISLEDFMAAANLTLAPGVFPS